MPPTLHIDLNWFILTSVVEASWVTPPPPTQMIMQCSLKWWRVDVEHADKNTGWENLCKKQQKRGRERTSSFSMLREVQHIICTGSGGDKDRYGLHLARPCPTRLPSAIYYCFVLLINTDTTPDPHFSVTSCFLVWTVSNIDT